MQRSLSATKMATNESFVGRNGDQINAVNGNQSTDLDKSKAKVYSNVVISLENCILPEEKLSVTPSMTDGLQYDHEVDLRIVGCELIQSSGHLLRLPQVAMATGQVLFQRYYYSKSFVRYPMETTAMACVTLASKIEEAPRRIRDVINVFDHMKKMRLKSDDKPLVLDNNYITLKNDVIKAERRLLKELGFCVHVKHPHKFIVTLLQVLENEKNHQLMQTSWNYMNDSLRTSVFVRYSPETIACACIYLSARVLGVALPNRPNWFEVFGVSEEQIQDVSVSILKLYARPKSNQEELEKTVEQLRKDYENSKLKSKELTITENGTPNPSEKSPNSRQTSPLSRSKSENISPKNRLKSIGSVISHISSPKRTVNESSPNQKSGSKSRTVSPIGKDRSYYSHEKNRDKSYRERERSPPKSYSYEYSRSRSRSPDRNGRHHKHKRITYSRSRSRSPVHSHRHHNHHNTKHHSYGSNRKSGKRSKSPYSRDNTRDHYSRSRRSRSRETYKHSEGYRRS